MSSKTDRKIRLIVPDSIHDNIIPAGIIEVIRKRDDQSFVRQESEPQIRHLYRSLYIRKAYR